MPTGKLVFEGRSVLSKKSYRGRVVGSMFLPVLPMETADVKGRNDNRGQHGKKKKRLADPERDSIKDLYTQ